MNKFISDLKNLITDKTQIYARDEKTVIEIRRFPNNIIKINNKSISWIALQNLLINGDFTLLINEKQEELKFGEKKHGGLRSGAGRKTKTSGEKKKVKSFTLSNAAIDHLEKLCERYDKNKSEVIELLIHQEAPF